MLAPAHIAFFPTDPKQALAKVFILINLGQISSKPSLLHQESSLPSCKAPKQKTSTSRIIAMKPLYGRKINLYKTTMRIKKYHEAFCHLWSKTVKKRQLDTRIQLETGFIIRNEVSNVIVICTKSLYMHI